MKTPEEVIAKLEDAKNGVYSAAELESIWVPNEMLPESYHDEREGGRSLDRLQEPEQTEEIAPDHNRRNRKKSGEVDSVVISHGKIMYGNQDRINTLNQYQNDVDNENEISYNVNEYKLYRNQLAFAEAMEIELE